MRWTHLLLLLLPTSGGLAAPPSVRVTGAAHTGCPDGQALAARLPQAPSGAAFRVTYRLQLGGRSAQVVRLDGPGQRTLHSTADTCGPLADAVVLVMILAVDPLAVTPEPPPAPPTRVARVAEPPRPPVPRGWAIHAALGAAGGATPVAPTGRLGLAYQRPGWSLGLGLRAQLAGTDALGQGAQVAVSAVAGEIAGCWHANARWALCTVGLAGRMQAEGRGFPQNAKVSGPWLAAGGRVRAALWQGERWRVAAFAEGLAGPVALELTWLDRVVWASEPWHAQGGLDLAWRFW